MTHWELICVNPLTGRRAWAVRSIPTGRYGEPFNWAMVIVRPHWFSGTAKIMLVQGMSVTKRREILWCLRRKPWFRRAVAIEHGQRFVWNRAGSRSRA